MDFLAMVMTAFWPAIAVRSSCADLAFLAVLHGIGAAADVQDDLVQTRDLHVVLVAEFFFHRGADAVA